jgi:predicted RNA-binding Zn ribbon-like protein
MLSGMEEAEPRTPAPGRLGLLQEFVNSVELPDGDDELATAAAATRWLTAHHLLLTRPLTEKERKRLLDVREGLRTVLMAHAGAQVSSDVTAALTRQLNGAALRPVISESGASLVGASTGVAALLSSLAAAIVEATVAGTWQRLKVCRADSCRWAFYDASKNGRGAWCSMRSCGSRHKARTYRQRRRERLSSSA